MLMWLCLIIGIKGVTDQGHVVMMGGVVSKGRVRKAMITMTNTIHRLIS